MRKSQNWASAYTKRKNKSTFDLVTSHEQKFASQNSEWTSGTQQRTKHRTATTIRDQDDYEDVIAEELDSLFITPEEQEDIRRVLQLARKSKINASNAFQLPVKVINPLALEATSMRFWKFASELLSTSMNIYEKRIENVFMSSNNMASKLLRTQRNQDDASEGSDLTQSRSKRKFQMLLDLEAIEDQEVFSIHQLQIVQTQDPVKITGKQKKSFFLSDIVFQKRMQLFDSNNISSLFLNSFQLDQSLQISFFNSSVHKTHVQVDYDQSLSLSIHQGDQIVDNLFDYELKKLNFICQNKTLFNEIKILQQETMRHTRFQDISVQNNYQSIYQQFHETIQEEVSNNLLDKTKTVTDNLQDLESYNDSFCTEHPIKQNNYISLENSRSTVSLENQQQSLSEKPRDSHTFLDNREYHSMIIPWELEFKGSKLQRKKEKTVREKTIKSKTTLNIIDLDFTLQELERQNVFQILSQSKLSKLKMQKMKQKHLMPKTIDPFIEIASKKRSILLSENTPKYSSSYQPLSTFQDIHIKMEHPFENLEFNLKEQVHQQTTFNAFVPQEDQFLSETQTPSQNLIYNNFSSQGLRNIKTFGLSNIRDIKKTIYNELTLRKSLTMSDISLQLSPAGMLIILLHLANENNIKLISIDNQTDINIQV